MDIGQFSSLSKAEQLAEAGRIAGVPGQTFDGIHRTESGRGLYMRSPAGAKGHFGLMDSTASVMSQRLGFKVNPDDYSQSLLASAYVMKENMGRFKNLPDALRAYNGGWNPKTWGNSETASYAAKVLGSDDGPDYENTASTALASEGIGGAAIGPRSAAADLWDRGYNGDRSKAPKAPAGPSKLAAAMADIGAPNPEPTAPSFGMTTQATDKVAGQQVAEAKAQDERTFMDTAKAAAFATAPVALLQAMYRDEEPADPNFKVPEEAFKDRDSADQKEIATASSDKQLKRILFDLDYAKEQEKIVWENGTTFGLAASFLAAAPEAVFFGGITSIAMRGAGVGSIALAAEGKYGAAMVSSFAEGAAGNVINTAALDMLGKRQGENAYALGAAAGILNPLLARGYLGRSADRYADGIKARELIANATAKEEALMTKAQGRLPEGHTPDDLRAEMDRISAEDARAANAEHTSPVPESRKMVAGDTEELDKIDTPESANKAPDTTGALDTAKQTPAWEKPSFQSDRQAALMARTDWQASLEQVSDGVVKAGDVSAISGIKATPAVLADPVLAFRVKGLSELAEKYGVNNVLFTNKVLGEESGTIMSFGDKHVIGLRPGAMPTAGNHTGWHELGHAIYHQHAATAPPELMARIHADWENFAAGAKAGDEKAWASRWAATSPNTESRSLSNYSLSRDEYMAEQYVKHLQSAALAGQLGGQLSKGVINQIVTAVTNVIEYVKDLVSRGFLKTDDAADEFFKGVFEGGFNRVTKGQEFLAPELKLPSIGDLAASHDAIPPALAKEVSDFLSDPVAIEYGLSRLPMGTPVERAEAKQILALYKRALSDEFVVDEKRLSTLLNKVDALNPTSNMMLRSKNPVVRMAAIELLENGGGAAGRRSTASIAKYMHERALIGSAIVEQDQSFRMWTKLGPMDNLKEALTGTKRAEFNRLVAEEIEQRRYPGHQSDFGDHVRAAADSMEASFERARLLQVNNKTSGWAALPQTSKGYMPHRMKANTFRQLTESQKQALHAEFTDQFITISQFDPSFSDQLASKYMDRMEHKALGGFDAPAGMHQPGAADTIREALEQMDLSRDEVIAMMKRHTAGAMAHTKKRLNIDLRKTITAKDGSTFRLLDLYDTDMLSLLRGQSQRISGEVALSQYGVMGKPGLTILRRAMGYGSDTSKAVRKEIDAFDQIGAEFMGQPFGNANKWVDRATQMNSLMSMGGMGFNQLGEVINVGATLGVKAALANVSEFSRLRSEILAMAKGKKANNGLLDSIETMGGAEFGTDAYKMVFPMDNPDLFANSIGNDTLSVGDKLLRGGGHLQSKLSLWRSIHSVQTRNVAEQIVLKATKALKDGTNDFHLRDMGMDDDMLGRLRKDINDIATVRDGKVVSFDITKATDKEAAHAFIQAIHRGSSQIIQGTFIGESGKYVHDSWLRMLAQFRGFSITAIDKQFNRQLGNRGATGVAVMTLAAMSAAAPLYMARTYAASVGRADQDEYLEKHLSFGSIARATTNYIATSGLGGDVLDALTAVTGTGEYTGGRSGTNSTMVGNLVAPAAGKVDKLWGAVQNTKDGTDAAALLKEAPLSRLPFVIPAFNALQD